MKICSVDGCVMPHKGRGYCSSHYFSLKHSGELSGKTCSIDGCDKGVSGRGYCHTHYYRAKKSGEFNTDKCYIASCTERTYAKGYCSSHYHIERTYNITPEKYEKLRLSQNGCCFICGLSTKLVVDHNHDTGQVRGLLCHHCNTGLGLFMDDENKLNKAIEYLNICIQ